MTGLTRGFAANTGAATFARFAALARAGRGFFAGAGGAQGRFDRILVDRVEADECDGVGAIDGAALGAAAVAARAACRSRAPVASVGVGGVFLREGRFFFAYRESEGEPTAAAFAALAAFTTLPGFAPFGCIAFEDRAFDAQFASSVVDRAAEAVCPTAGGGAGLTDAARVTGASFRAEYGLRRC